MLNALRYFWKEQPLALSAFLLAMAFLVFFGARFVLHFIYFHDPVHRNQALEPWMSPKYVGMSYQLPPEIIREVMQLDRFEGKRVTIKKVAEGLDISLEELERRVRNAQSKVKILRDQRGRKIFAPTKPHSRDGGR
ncbi:hypothetical protein [Cohaesibacter intestini]|uniref:hypothetical protein n=1 Tax=Cohaesibacter intestini TaxID=2211145 RepID=UPI000DEA67EE|nr:hypothetical protein [Cohaesibacter intestini]